MDVTISNEAHKGSRVYIGWLHTVCWRRWRLGGETATYDWFDR